MKFSEESEFSTELQVLRCPESKKISFLKSSVCVFSHKNNKPYKTGITYLR